MPESFYSLRYKIGTVKKNSNYGARRLPRRCCSREVPQWKRCRSKWDILIQWSSCLSENRFLFYYVILWYLLNRLIPKTTPHAQSQPLMVTKLAGSITYHLTTNLKPNPNPTSTLLFYNGRGHTAAQGLLFFVRSGCQKIFGEIWDSYFIVRHCV